MKTVRSFFSFSQTEIKTAFDQARLVKKGPGLKVLQAPTSDDAKTGKLLIIIPKVVGKAHDRNKLRRRMQSIFYEERLFEKPVITILLVYKTAMSLSFEEIKGFLKGCFKES